MNDRSLDFDLIFKSADPASTVIMALENKKDESKSIAIQKAIKAGVILSGATLTAYFEHYIPALLISVVGVKLLVTAVSRSIHFKKNQ